MVTHRWPGAQSAGTFARLLQQGVVAMLDGVVLSRKRMVYKNGTQSVNNWFSQFLVWNWGETLLNFVFSMWIRMIMHWVSRGVCGDGGWPEKTGFECVYQRKCGSKASGGFLGIGQNISKPSDSMNVAWTLKAPFFFWREHQSTKGLGPERFSYQRIVVVVCIEMANSGLQLQYSALFYLENQQ